MKKLSLLTYIFLFFSYVTTAQTEKGKWIIGGGSSISFTSNSLKIDTSNNELDGGTLTQFTVSPAAGYFVIDDLAIGLQLPITFEKSSIEDFDGVDSENKTSSIVASPFVRYYFGQSSVKPFLQANVGIGSSKTTIDNQFENSESTSNIFQYGLSGGVAIFINSQISVDLGVGYVNTSSKPKDSDLNFKNSTIGFNAGFNIFL